MKSGFISLAVAVFLGLSGCSLAPPGTDIHDPYEESNRKAHQLNNDLAQIFFGSSDADGPQALEEDSSIDPELTKPIVNFADNLGLPSMALNGVLQADLEGALTNSLRFVVNSTLGLLGFFDPATEMGLEAEGTDFGETLAVWGAREGAYIELPVFGPTSERALAGDIVDMFIDPLNFVGTPKQHETASNLSLLAWWIEFNQAGGAVDSLYDSIDSYTQLKQIYFQNRRFDLGTTTQVVDPYDELFGE